MAPEEQVKPDAEQSGESSVKEIADFSALQTEFTEEDCGLAAAGLSTYAAGLAREDDAR